MAINLNQLDLSAPDSHTSQYTEFIGGNSQDHIEFTLPTVPDKDRSLVNFEMFYKQPTNVCQMFYKRLANVLQTQIPSEVLDGVSLLQLCQ